MSEETSKYDASQIQVLEGWEAIRKRPGMYIGSTSERGLRYMMFEVADRAVNEVLAGNASCVDITLTSDSGVCVADDGRGVRIDAAGDLGISGLEALLTRMQTGAGPGGRHDVTLGFCGVGPFVVNALSSRMTAEVRRGGARWVQAYARGVAVTPLTGAGTSTGSGTTITFWPDADIFGTAEYSFDGLAGRFRELALLNRGLEISLTDQRRPGEARSARGARAPRGSGTPTARGTSWPSLTSRKRNPFIRTSSASSGRNRGWRGRRRWPCVGVPPMTSGSGASPTAGPLTAAHTSAASATGWRPQSPHTHGSGGC
jgi:DNA gyrase subunit B